MINAGDAEGLMAIAADNLVFLDEDGHRMPRAIMIDRLTAGQKRMEISSVYGQRWDDVGWASFNYTLEERFLNRDVTLRGTASIVSRRNEGGVRMIHMVHNSLEQTA